MHSFLPCVCDLISRKARSALKCDTREARDNNTLVHIKTKRKPSENVDDDDECVCGASYHQPVVCAAWGLRLRMLRNGYANDF